MTRIVNNPIIDKLPGLLLDEMYPPSLAQVLSEKGHDVVAVADSTDLVGNPDSLILQVARQQGSCLVTENVRDFAVLAQQSGHAGIMFVHGRRLPRTPSGMSKLADALHTLLAEGRLPGDGEVHWLG